MSKPKAQAQKTSGRPSIAVLPFTNMSSDAEQEFFSGGITEDIDTELARFNSLIVIARNSSFHHFKGQSPKLQNVGSALGVQYVVEGSVRKSGKRVRITAQLVEAATGNHVWANATCLPSLRVTHLQKHRDLWLEGFRKAGFDC